MGLAEIVLGVLAVWRVTHFLHAEEGPWDLVVRLRRAAGAGFFARLLDCFYCLSAWVALLVALVLAHDWREYLLVWLGMSGGASLLERMVAPKAPFVEDPLKEEPPEVLLRKPEAAPRAGEHREH